MVAIGGTIIVGLAFIAGSNVGSLIGDDLDTAASLGIVFSIVALVVIIWIDHRQRGRHALAPVWSTYWRVWIPYISANVMSLYFIGLAKDENIIYVFAIGLALEPVGFWVGLNWATRFYNKLEIGAAADPEAFL